MAQIVDHRGKPFGPPPQRGPVPVSNAQNQRMLKARFEGGLTTRENRKLWQLADGMSIDAAASWQTRRILRMRHRQEYHNNSFYFGLVDTIGNYVVGTGPRLQLTTKNKALNDTIEKQFADWAKEVRLAETLKSMRGARIYNGEGFALMRNNPNLSHPVKLDVFEIEADQVASPMFGMYPSQYPDQYFDGIVLDPWGRPDKYHVLRQHPGAFGAFVLLGTEFDTWPARYVIHDFKKIRPGQQRGVPEAQPALELFAEVRRYSRAVLGAAEDAADRAGILKTTGPAANPTRPSPDYSPLDTIELTRRMLTVLPEGYDMSQMKAEQPTTTYDMYVNELLKEIARCLNVPLFFVTLDARLANMASAYVVTQPFARSVQVDRSQSERHLDHIFDEWLTEAIRIPGLLPRDTPNEFPHAWRWPRIGSHADPKKEADAQGLRLKAFTSSIPHECAEMGLDYQEVLAAQAQALGIDVPTLQKIMLQSLYSSSGNPAPASLSDAPVGLSGDPEFSTDDDEEVEIES